MSSSKPKQKLYVYVDETGQDAGSGFFVVVSVVSSAEQDPLRQQLLTIEQETKMGAKKWHTSRSPEKDEYIRTIIREAAASESVYYGAYPKPLPFFVPLLEVVAEAIKDKAGNKPYIAIVYVDGIDKQKARELTDGLRLKGISLRYVRSARDESEPMIRLADRWAGCIRDALEDRAVSAKLLSKAEWNGHIKRL